MAQLSDLAKKVRNVVSRNSQGFLLTEGVDTTSASYSIDDVNTSQDYFDVYDTDLSGDSEFAAGEEIFVDGSTGNDGNYTVESVSTGDYDGQADGTDSRIYVEESIDDSTVDGTIYVAKEYIWKNFGRFMNASFETSAISSSMDQDGRESTELFELTLSMAMMQTANTELSLMEDLAMPDPKKYDFYLNGHTMLFSGSHQITTSDLNAATTTATGAVDFNALGDPEALQFVNVLLKPSPEIDLSGEESSIGLEFTGKVELQELSDLDTTQTITISKE